MDSGRARRGTRWRIFRPGVRCVTDSGIMASTRQWVLAAVAVTLMTMLGGCLSNPIPRGAVIGGLSGAALGAGTGVLISNATLLGSDAESKIPLEKAESIAVGAAVGAVVGAIVGSMIAHQRESGKPPSADNASAQAMAPTAF
jgi:ABC-type Fe3+-siderophore transport system permease subunit